MTRLEAALYTDISRKEGTIVKMCVQQGSLHLLFRDKIIKMEKWCGFYEKIFCLIIIGIKTQANFSYDEA